MPAFAPPPAMPQTRRQSARLRRAPPIAKSPPPRPAPRRAAAKPPINDNAPAPPQPPAKSEPPKPEPQPTTPHDIEDLPPTPPTTATAHSITNHLRQHYTLPHPPSRPPTILDTLIATILSQATSRPNSTHAFATLKETFPTYTAALHAGPPAIEAAIQTGGLAHAKSRAIHAILTSLHAAHGACTLEHLRNLPDAEAKEQLLAFRGVGPKTASCVLMFAMRRPEFPVDTHVRRIVGRLGWMRAGASAEESYDVLNECLPDDVKRDLHVLLVRHGREICKARNPRCDVCPLAAQCPAVGVAKVELGGAE